MVPEVREVSYRQRLETIKLTTMEERRRRDLITTFRFRNQIDNVDSEKFSEKHKERATIGNSKKLSLKLDRKEVKKNFNIRVVDDWN